MLTTIVSPNAVESPLDGTRAAILYVELLELLELERGPTDEAYGSLGVVVLGDVVTLRDDDHDEIAIVARRARINPATPHARPAPLDEAPPELVPLLAKAKGRGLLCYRQVSLATNDRVLLTASVEPATSVVAAGYRSGTQRTYVARDDLEPVILDEVVAAPAW